MVDFTQFSDDETEKRAAAGNVMGAADANPDDAADTVKLARRYNLPPELVAPIKPEMSQQAKIEDATGAIQDAPKTRGWMASDAYNAKVAQGDEHNLSGIEKQVGMLPGFGRMLGKANAEAGLFLSMMSTGVNRILDVPLHMMMGDYDEYDDKPVGKVIPPTSEVAMQKFNEAKEYYDFKPDEHLTGLGKVGAGFGTLFGYLPQIFTTGPAAVDGLFARTALSETLTAGAMKAQPMVVTQAANEQSDLQSQGMSAEDAAKVTATDYGVGTVLNALPLGFTGRWYKRLAVGGATGAAGVPIANEAHNAALPDGATPAKTDMSDVLVGALTNAAMAGIAGHENTVKAAAAQQAHQVLSEIDRLAKASQTSARDTGTFEDFMQHVTGDNLYLDPHVLNQAGIAEKLAEVSPSVREQYPEAERTGTMMKIPVSEFAARIAPTDLSAQVLDHLKTDPNGFSKAEADDYLANHADTMRQAFEESVAKAKGDQTFRDSANQVEDQVYQNLKDQNVYPDVVNRGMALLAKNSAATMASKMGVMPHEFWAEHGVEFGSQAAREGALSQGNRRTLADLEPDELESLLTDHGEQVANRHDAESRLSDGEHLFAMHENSDQPHLIKNVDELKAYTPDQLISVPHDAADRFLNGKQLNQAGQRGGPGVGYEHEIQSLDQRVRDAHSAVDTDGRGSRGLVPREWEEPSAYAGESGGKGGTSARGATGERAGREEQSKLIAAAKEHGFYIGADDPLFRVLAAADKEGGAEHEVYIAGKGDNRVVIRNTSKGEFGNTSRYSPADYLRRLQKYNQTFPEHQIHMIGVHEEADGKVSILTAQPFVEGKEFKTHDELDKALVENGWFGIKGDPAYKYQHMETGAVISDVHTGNILHIGNKLFPIDVIVDKLPKRSRGEETLNQKPQRSLAEILATGRLKDLKGNKEEALKYFDREIATLEKSLQEPRPDWIQEGSLEKNIAAYKEARRMVAAGEASYERPSGKESNENWEPDDELISRAKKFFGKTTNPNEAGYILPDGTMLDLSGRHYADKSAWRDLANTRNVDHRELHGENIHNKASMDDLIKHDGSEGMYEFMARTGAMRVDAASGVASVSRPPTDKQIAAIGNVRKGKYLALSFNRPDGEIVHDGEMDVADPRKVRKFFDEAQKQEGGSGVLAQPADGGPRGQYSPAHRFITLTNKADPSTVIHELGHHFLEQNMDIAGRLMGAGRDLTAGEQSIVDDMNNLSRWLGLKDVDEWHSLPFEQKEPLHEKVAESFEHYLMSGKAPSIELQPVFQRMRSFMLGVYKSLKNFLQLHPDAGALDPDTREIFDRMLASTEQIQLAEKVRSLEPLFKTPEEAAKYGVDFEQYHNLGVQASADAIDELQTKGIRDMRWMHNVRDKAIRQLQRESAAARSETMIRARRQILSEPVYQAWQFLTGKMTDADKVHLPSEKSDPNHVDPSRDSLFTAIAKLGGLDWKSVSDDGWWDTAGRSPVPVFGKPLLRREGGLTPDHMAERLAELGYLPTDANGKHDLRDFEELFAREAGGSKQYSRDADVQRQAMLEAKPGEFSPVSEFGAGRLDEGSLRATPDVQSSMIERLRDHGMVSKEGGLHPDVAAEMFGFGSGGELVDALSKARKPKDAIEELTDQMMLQEHGELATPEAIAREADKAIHNEVRARMAATQANALAKAAGTKKVLLEAAKQVADRVIADRKVRDLRPDQFAASEARASKALDKAFKAGKIAEAANEARNQLFNMLATRAAYKAQDEVTKGLQYLKKFDKDSVRAKIAVDFRDQLDNLLAQYDLRKGVSGKTLDARRDLLDFVEAQRAAGFEPNVDEDLLRDASLTHYKDLTVDQFRSLMDSVKSLEQLGRRELAIQDGEKAAALKEVVDEAVKQLGDLPQKPPTTNRGLSKVDEKFLKAKSAVAGADASLLKIEQVMDWLDSGKLGGVFNRIVFRRIADAGNRENDLQKEMVARFRELNESLPKEFGEHLDDRFTFPELIDSKTGKASTLSKREMLSVALNMSNESNASKLLRGEGWSHDAVVRALGKLTEHDIAFVNGTVKAINALWPEIEALERRLGNTAPPKVEGRPLELANGTLEGGYYPMVYDPERSFAAEQRNQKSGDQLFENNYQKATTPKGHTKARNGYSAPVLLSIDVIPRHVAQVIHDIAYREAIIDADRFLARPEIREAVESTLGREYYKQFRPWLQSLANDRVYDSPGLAKWDGLMHASRTTATMVGLGYRATTMLVHGSTAASNSVGEIGAGWMAKGIRAFAGSPEKMAQTRDFIFERSPEMAHRMNEVDRDVRDQLREMEVRHGVAGSVHTMLDEVRRFAYYGIAMLDMASAMPTWMGAYMKAMEHPEKGGLGMSEQDAIYYADKSVRNAHGGTGQKDLSAIQRGSETMKLFTMFYTFWNHFYNRQRDIGRRAVSAGQSAMAGDYAGARRDFAMVLARSWFYFVLPVMFHALLKNQEPDGDESWPAWAAKEIGLSLFSGIPVARDLAAAAATGHDYQVTPAASVVKALWRTGADIKHHFAGEEVSDKWLKHSVETAGYVFGLPTGQASTSAQFLWDVAHGNQTPHSLADWYRGMVHGDVNK